MAIVPVRRAISDPAKQPKTVKDLNRVVLKTKKEPCRFCREVRKKVKNLFGFKHEEQ